MKSSRRSGPAAWGKFTGQLSPDGRWLAYTSDVSGRTEVYVQAFPIGRGTWQVSEPGGMQPKPGTESFETGAQERLFAMPPSFGDDYSYDVVADGRRFLVNTVVSDTSQPIIVVLNWSADLEK